MDAFRLEVFLTHKKPVTETRSLQCQKQLIYALLLLQKKIEEHSGTVKQVLNLA